MEADCIKKHPVILILLFFIPFVIYSSTICPNIYWHDAAEFQAVGYLLGIAHPAGSPLYALTAKIFTFIPFGSIAFKVNLVSAFFGALLIPLVFLLIIECIEIIFPSKSSKSVSLLSGILAVSFYAVSNSLWSTSIQAEVYAFQNCMIVLIAFLLVRGLRREEKQSLYLAAFFFGLSSGAHIIMIVYIPALLIFLWIFYRKSLSVSQLGIIVMLVILGASIYLYLPVRSSVNPYWDWGNPENIKNFIIHVTDRKDAKYHTYFSSAKFIQVLKKYGMFFQDDFAALGILFGVTGLAIFFRKNSRLFFTLGAFFFSQWFFFIRYWDNPTAFIATFVFFTLAIGVGLFFIVQNIQRLITKRPLRRFIYSALVTLCAIQIFFIGTFHGKINDRSGYWSPYIFFQHVYNQIEFKGTLLASLYCFGTGYLQQCENYRPDITNLSISEIFAPRLFNTVTQERHPLVTIPPIAGAKIGEAIINTNIKNRAFYWDPTPPYKFYSLVKENLQPDGFLFSITPSPCTLTQEIINRHNKKIDEYLKSFTTDISSCHDQEENNWYASILSNQSAFFTDKKENLLGIYYLRLAHDLSPENDSILNALGTDYASIGDLKKAEIYFKKALNLAPYQITILKNIGQLYLDSGNYQQSIFYYQKYLEQDPKNPGVYYNLAICFAKIGRGKEVRDALQKVILLDPKNALGENARKKLAQMDN